MCHIYENTHTQVIKDVIIWAEPLWRAPSFISCWLRPSKPVLFTACLMKFPSSDTYSISRSERENDLGALCLYLTGIFYPWNLFPSTGWKRELTRTQCVLMYWSNTPSLHRPTWRSHNVLVSHALHWLELGICKYIANMLAVLLWAVCAWHHVTRSLSEWDVLLAKTAVLIFWLFMRTKPKVSWSEPQ